MIFGSSGPSKLSILTGAMNPKERRLEDEELVTSVLYDLCNTNDLRNLIIPSTTEPYMKVVL